VCDASGAGGTHGAYQGANGARSMRVAGGRACVSDRQADPRLTSHRTLDGSRCALHSVVKRAYAPARTVIMCFVARRVDRDNSLSPYDRTHACRNWAFRRARELVWASSFARQGPVTLCMPYYRRVRRSGAAGARNYAAHYAICVLQELSRTIRTRTKTAPRVRLQDVGVMASGRTIPHLQIDCLQMASMAAAWRSLLFMVGAPIRRPNHHVA